ncbi:hypothetical protein AVEN_19328-1 [Araneus ventricosus]|uniref:Uncharacterized protein n=1 Tax=Araneus ventricosus TaxID=182803 RepID=A0A4Y2M488_ARAVE|nr:hypothetical protein AVEN_19328-1 [Araneus ventricosus]
MDSTGPIDKSVVVSYSVPDTPIDIFTQFVAFKRSLASLMVSSIASTDIIKIQRNFEMLVVYLCRIRKNVTVFFQDHRNPHHGSHVSQLPPINQPWRP